MYSPTSSYLHWTIALAAGRYGDPNPGRVKRFFSSPKRPNQPYGPPADPSQRNTAAGEWS
jgi:hypothetical protein